MLPAHPRTSVSRTRSYNEEEHGKPLRAILGVDRRCYRRPTACSPVWPLILLSSLFLPFFHRLLRFLCLPPSPVILTSLPFTLARVHPLFLRVPFTFLLLPSLSATTFPCPSFLFHAILLSASRLFPFAASSDRLVFFHACSFPSLLSFVCLLCSSICTLTCTYTGNLADDPPIARR